MLMLSKSSHPSVLYSVHCTLYSTVQFRHRSLPEVIEKTREKLLFFTSSSSLLFGFCPLPAGTRIEYDAAGTFRRTLAAAARRASAALLEAMTTGDAGRPLLPLSLPAALRAARRFLLLERGDVALALADVAAELVEIRAEFDELMKLSLEAGTLKRSVAYESYVDDSFVKNIKPVNIVL